MKEYLNFAKTLALEFGEIIRVGYYSSSISYEAKISPADLVSNVDKEVEEKSKQRILEKYPDHKFIAEEAVSAGHPCQLTESPTWILDPIDGTTNFINKFPYCCYSLGFYVNKQAEIGVIYNPILNDIYYAIRGGGSFHNDKPIKVSSNIDLKSSLILSDWGNGREPDLIKIKTENFENIVMHSRGVRSMGSAALHMCFVASGASDAFYEYGIHCWDLAAGRLIVEEAGGVCTLLDGSPLDLMKRQILACSNAQLIPQITKLIKSISYPPDQ